jgi:uncharacterized protein (DUF2147 family)
MKRINMLLFLIIFSTASACYAAGDDILGVWFNQEKDATIEIFKCSERYCGKIVWLKEPNYPVGSKDGVPGTPKLDHNNPKPGMKNAPILGLEIMHDFLFAGDAEWKDGRVYDPKNGKTYSGKITLVSPHELNLRGYIGIPLIGRTAVWTR